MSLVELVARQPSADVSAETLPDLLAAEALGRLAQGGTAGEAAAKGGGAGVPAANAVTVHLAKSLIEETPDRAITYVARLLDHGVSVERVVRHYLPSALDLLGEDWVEDRLDFATVTHAAGQTMRVLREGLPPPAITHAGPPVPRVLLVRSPGEYHTLGLQILAFDMRRTGWLVRLDLSGESAVLASTLATNVYDFIGFTAACPERESALAEVVTLARHAQPKAALLLGGSWAGVDTDLGARLGVDMVVGRLADPVAAIAKHFKLHAGRAAPKRDIPQVVT